MRTISVEQSVATIPNGASLMVGGFMGVGTPERVIDEIVRRRLQSHRDRQRHRVARPGDRQAHQAKLVHKAIVSHIGLNPETQRQMMAGGLEVDLVPQGR